MPKQYGATACFAIVLIIGTQIIRKLGAQCIIQCYNYLESLILYATRAMCPGFTVAKHESASKSVGKDPLYSKWYA